MSLIINHGINKIEELERENARLFAQLMRVNSKTGRYREAIDKIKELIPIKYENEFEDIGKNVEDAQLGLAVPSYMEIDSLEDLQPKE